METDISTQKNTTMLGTLQLSVQQKRQNNKFCKQLKRRKQKQEQKVESVGDEIHTNAELGKVNKQEQQIYKAQKAYKGAARELEARPCGSGKLNIAENVQNIPRSIDSVKTAKVLKTESMQVDISRSDGKVNKRKRGREAEVRRKLKKIKPKNNRQGNTIVQKEKLETSALTRKQRRNRKKNNSKKNKFSHLFLNIEKGKGSVGLTVSATDGKEPETNSLMSVKSISNAVKSPSLMPSSENTNMHIKRKTAVQNLKVCCKQQKVSALRKSVLNQMKSKRLSTKKLKTESKGRIVAGHVNIRDTSRNLFDDEDNTQDNSDEDGIQDMFCNENCISLSDSSDTAHLKIPCPADKMQGKGKSLDRNKPLSIAEKAREKLNAARFRYLNEQLYTSTGKEALEMFQDDPEAFQVYHHGFQSQVSRWPLNPLDVIIEQLRSMPKRIVVADFGCGDAHLAESLPQNKVFSFDLVATRPCITVCDMAKVPLEKSSIDVAVFCLSLMGTNLSDYLFEANRVIKTGGILKIAEVVSRFYSISSFVNSVQALGFHLDRKVFLGEMFQLFTFRKVRDASPKRAPHIQLKACHYKRR